VKKAVSSELLRLRKENRELKAAAHEFFNVTTNPPAVEQRLREMLYGPKPLPELTAAAPRRTVSALALFGWRISSPDFTPGPHARRFYEQPVEKTFQRQAVWTLAKC
jgi:hypothetical protein